MFHERFPRAGEVAGLAFRNRCAINISDSISKEEICHTGLEFKTAVEGVIVPTWRQSM